MPVMVTTHSPAVNFDLAIAIPIYKPRFNDIEAFSIGHSLKTLAPRAATFIHPLGLDVGAYREQFPGHSFMPLPAAFFESHRNYNQLCYEVGFYTQFQPATHLLILQPDALVVSPDIDRWCATRYDFIGGPESHQYSYDIRAVPPFDQLDFLAPIKLHGCNGGLSLRRIGACIEALQEYPALTRFFRSYGVGIGEDIFFSLMGRVSDSFQVANEIAAAKFAITDKFEHWIAFNGGALPFGFHAWYRNEHDQAYVMNLLSPETELA